MSSVKENPAPRNDRTSDASLGRAARDPEDPLCKALALFREASKERERVGNKLGGAKRLPRELLAEYSRVRAAEDDAALTLAIALAVAERRGAR